MPSRGSGDALTLTKVALSLNPKDEGRLTADLGAGAR